MPANRPRFRSQLRPFGRVVRAAAVTACVLLLVRTFLVAGWLVAYRTTGASMAPTLLGSHYWVACPACSSRFPVDAELPPVFELAVCPFCGTPGLPPPSSTAESGARLLIDRITPTLRGVRRWEVVVLRDPVDQTQLAVKRVVGLPGERVALRDSAVWIDGRRLQRDLPTIHRTSIPLAWSAVPTSDGPGADWRQVAGDVDTAWGGRAEDSEIWLALQPRAGGARASFDDDLPYNLGATHAVHAATDLFLGFHVELSEGAVLTVAVGDAELTLNSRTRSIRLSCGGAAADAVATRRASSTGRVAIAVFDGASQAEVAFEGEEPIRLELPLRCAGAAVAPQIGLVGGRVELAQIKLRRGIYYEAPKLERETQLGPDEYFLLGDNAARSIDSRTWRRPGVKRNSLLGRVMRWPASRK